MSQSFGLPHYQSPNEAVQPDYGKWKSIVKGMKVEEVVAVLGQPLDDPLRGGRPKDARNAYYHYGFLDVPLLPHPRTYAFTIGFDEAARVWYVEDPFVGSLSETGVPTAPQWITPVGHPTFDHYPRVLDLRWSPSSGEYPVVYELELGHGGPEEGRFGDAVVDDKIPGPYTVQVFGGAQPGRARVRGSNHLGTGPWSDYKYFTFVQ